jgi:3'(2'), 5'-bisphosphate nucleotidase
VAFEAMRDGSRRAMRTSSVSAMKDARVVVSRSHRAPTLEAGLAMLGAREATTFGSAGIKASLVAGGEADVYLQPGRAGKRWDACAPEAIVLAAGGAFSDTRGVPIEYASGELENAFGLVATNAALADAARAPFQSADRPRG